MKPLDWVRFTWDLEKLPELDPQLPAHYQIAPATKDDETELRKVFSSVFLLDSTWNPAIGDVMQKVHSWLDRAFASETNTILVLRHGLRIIGATVVSLDADAEFQLAPGPCVLMEYRNRGFGTRLLESALTLLREAGLSSATGIARESAPVSKFLYPKFAGVLVRAEVAPLLAA